MDSENMDLFQTLCFLACMQHGLGLIAKSPSYIREKKKTIKSALAAWQMLDFEVQQKLFDWALEWKFPLSECIEEISKEV